MYFVGCSILIENIYCNSYVCSNSFIVHALFPIPINEPGASFYDLRITIKTLCSVVFVFLSIYEH